MLSLNYKISEIINKAFRIAEQESKYIEILIKNSHINKNEIIYIKDFDDYLTFENTKSLNKIKKLQNIINKLNYQINKQKTKCMSKKSCRHIY